MDAPGNNDDLFHYVVLSGIDVSRGLVRMHYGDSKMRWVPLQPLARSWEAGGYATFLIRPRKKHAATQDDLRRAVVLEEMGKTADAIALYRHYLNSNPSSTVGWTNLANAHASAGDTQLAEVEYRNALFIDRDYFEALNNLACLLLQQKRFDEAEALARRAAGLNHSDRNVALNTLAQILSARTN
jgi:tetratricopeptide (TPR) repeat protein